MSIADIVIVLIVVAIFVFCVYKMIKGQQEGECSDCSAGGNCGAKHGDGHCQNSQDLLKKASEAAQKYENKKLSASK